MLLKWTGDVPRGFLCPFYYFYRVGTITVGN